MKKIWLPVFILIGILLAFVVRQAIQIQSYKSQLNQTLATKTEVVPQPTEKQKVVSKVESHPARVYSERDLLSDAGDANVVRVPRKRIMEALTNPTLILTAARADPVSENNQIVAWKISDISSRSIFDQLKIRNNDQIFEVNKQPLTNAGQALQIFSTLATINVVLIKIKRNEKFEKIIYKIID